VTPSQKNPDRQIKSSMDHIHPDWREPFPARLVVEYGSFMGGIVSGNIIAASG
jgi:hypothetical protein